MYDNAHLHLTLPANDPNAEQRLGDSVAFAQLGGELDERGCLRGKYRGLRIDYTPATRFLRVRGSLHTFVQGTNLGRFTAPEVLAACTELPELLGQSAALFTVHKLEIGVNLALPENPRAFLESLNSHKGSPIVALTPPSGASRPLAYGAHHAAYRLKYYDKGTYSRLQGRYPPDTVAPHLLRYELVFERQRPMCVLTGLPTLTLAHLPQPAVMASFATHLRTHWYLTQRRQHLSYGSLSMADATLLHAATDIAFWNAVRPTQARSTYQRYRTNANSLLRQYATPHPYDAILGNELERLTQFATAA